MCAGMTGGAPKDRNKPRKAGEMSYNECMAEWRRIQAQQKAELQEKAQANRERISELFSQKKYCWVQLWLRQRHSAGSDRLS